MVALTNILNHEKLLLPPYRTERQSRMFKQMGDGIVHRVVVGRVVNTIAVGRTKNGNVTRSVILSEGDFEILHKVKPDSALALEIENSEYRDQLHIFDVGANGMLLGHVEPVDETVTS
jgi:hypothetical protein